MAAAKKVGQKSLFPAIDDEVRNFIKDDPVCSNAEIKSGKGLEIFMARLEREVGYMPRPYTRKVSRQHQAWGEGASGPDIESRLIYMRSGKNGELAQSCFYFFILLRDDLDHASNIEARVGIEAYSAGVTYDPPNNEKNGVTPKNYQKSIFEALEGKNADLSITAQIFVSPVTNEMEIKDDIALLPQPSEQVFFQNDRIFFHVETHPNRSLILLLGDQQDRYWLAPGPSYSGPTRSNFERIPSDSGFTLDQTGPHRFVVIELETLAPIYCRTRTDPLTTVFSQQEKNLISLLLDNPGWRWGEVLVFVKKSKPAEH